MAKGTKVTSEEAYAFYQEYKKLHSYTKVAKKFHRSPDTVSRHCKIVEASVAAALLMEEKQKASK